MILMPELKPFKSYTWDSYFSFNTFFFSVLHMLVPLYSSFHCAFNLDKQSLNAI
jgi:hypothetical protein